MRTRTALMPAPAREGSVDAAIRLNIDPRKADHALRGLAVLPHGVGNNSHKSSV
jgi:ribosomal protein L1